MRKIPALTQISIFPGRVPSAPVILRSAAALAARVLHTPVTALDEAFVEDLLM